MALTAKYVPQLFRGKKEDAESVQKFVEDELLAISRVIEDEFSRPPPAPEVKPFWQYATLALAQAATVSALTLLLTIGGYYEAGDGGHGLYRQVASAPTHNEKFQTADLIWFELVPDQWLSFRTFGAKGDGGATDDSTKIQDGINFVEYFGGGEVHTTQGNFYVQTGIVISNCHVIGGGADASTIQSYWADFATPVTLASGGFIRGVSIFGKGANNDGGAFGANHHACIVSGVFGGIEKCRIWGGNVPLYITGHDNAFWDLDVSLAYGVGILAVTGSNWYVRCKFDHAPIGLSIPAKASWTAWAAGAVVAIGNVRNYVSWYIQCTKAGTTGSGPTLKNYGITIPDGTAEWKLLAPVGLASFIELSGTLESRFVQCDFTSDGSTYSVKLDSTVGYAHFTDCVCAQSIVIAANHDSAIFRGCDFGDSVTYNGGGYFEFVGNIAVGTGITVLVAANACDFLIADNIMPNGFITVQAGTSDRYSIRDNPGATVSNGGTGVNQYGSDLVTGQQWWGASDMAIGDSKAGWNVYNFGNAFLSALSSTALTIRRTSNDGGVASFYRGSSNVGSISVTTTATAYNTSSDARLKEDHQRFAAGPLLDLVEVSNFKWKGTGKRAYGVVGQQVEKIFPQVVSVERDYYQVDYSKFVPLLLQEVKDLRRRVADAEARLRALPPDGGGVAGGS